MLENLSNQKLLSFADDFDLTAGVSFFAMIRSVSVKFVVGVNVLRNSLHAFLIKMGCIMRSGVVLPDKIYALLLPMSRMGWL